MPALHKRRYWNPALDVRLLAWGKFSYKLQSSFYIAHSPILYLSVFMLEKEFAYLCNINQASNFAILNIQQQGKGGQNYVSWPAATPMTHLC